MTSAWPAWRAVSAMTTSITARRSRDFPLPGTGAEASPSVAMISLLVSQAARYSALSSRSDTEGATSIVPRTPARLAAGGDLFEPHRLDERQVLHEAGKVRAGPDRGAASVRLAEPGQLLQDGIPLHLESSEECLESGVIRQGE